MTASLRKIRLEEAACMVGAFAASAGWWLVHSAFWFAAVACIGLFMCLRAVRRDQRRSVGWFYLVAAMSLFGLLSAVGNPSYAVVAEIGKSVESCIPSKGAVQPCVDEAETLYGYKTSADDLGKAVDWRATFKSCVAHHGPRTCLEEFALNGVARNGAILGQDVIALCPSSSLRTDCLLHLLAKGVPIYKVAVPKDALDIGAAAHQGFAHK